jgi:hypothetical protein
VAEQKTTVQYETGDSAPLKEAEIVDHLTYANYKHNRKLSPEVRPSQWQAHGGFPKGSVERMEVKFQVDSWYER